MNNLHELFPEDISDECAAVIDKMLESFAEAWGWRYFNHIRRFHEANLPNSPDTFEPYQSWNR